MQGIGIIPEAGSLAGGKSAGGKAASQSTSAADGFLALLAALDGGAGLLLPQDLRSEQQKAKAQAALGQAQTATAGQAAAVTPNGQAEAGIADPAGTDPALVVPASNGTQNPALGTPSQTASATPTAPGAQPGATPPQAGQQPGADLPLPPTGQPLDRPSAAAPTTQGRPGPSGDAPLAPPPNATASGGQAATPPAAASENATRNQAAPAPSASPAKTPAQASQAAQQPATDAAKTASAMARAAARPEPQQSVQASTAVPQQTQSQAPSQAAAASGLPGAIAPRGTTNASGDPQVTPGSALPSEGGDAGLGERPAARGERTLMASTHPAKAAAKAKLAQQAATPAETAQAEQIVKPQTAAGQPQAAQGAQPAAQPPLWSAALASLQLLQSIDADGLGQGMATLDGSVEPLTGMTGNNSTSAKAGSEGYSQAASRLVSLPPSEQLAVQIQRAMNAQVQRFSIRLEPAELGRIDVRLDFARDGNVKAAITIERPETFDLMQRDIQSLERSLKESGIQGQGLTLDLQLGAGGHEQQEAMPEQDGRSAAQQETGDDDGAALPDLPAIVRAGAMTGLIDIRA